LAPSCPEGAGDPNAVLSPSTASVWRICVDDTGIAPDLSATTGTLPAVEMASPPAKAKRGFWSRLFGR